MNLEERLQAFLALRRGEPAPPPASPSDLLRWSSLERLPEAVPTHRLYLDIETMGLAEGFPVLLLGVGRPSEGGLQISQWALSDLDGEPRLLEEGLGTLAGILVTYNGRAFDLPRLRARAALWEIPFPEVAHEDLLPRSRRLYREMFGRLPLSQLGERLLGLPRSADIPGEAVAEHFRLYLETGERAWMDDVARHNRLDLVTLARLDARIRHDARRPDAPPRLAYGQGLDQVAEGAPEDALASFARAASDSALAQRAALQAARVAKSLGRAEAAHLRRAVEPLPAPRALLALARALEVEEGDLAGALQACERGLAELALLGPAAEGGSLGRRLSSRARRLRRRIATESLT